MFVIIDPVADGRPGCLVSLPAGSSLGRGSSEWAAQPDLTRPPPPAAPSQGLGRCHPQKPNQNQKYICKKVGNFIELAFLFSREVEESEETGQGEEEADPESRAGSGRPRGGAGRERSGQALGPAVPPLLLQGTVSSLLWVLKTEGGAARQI